MSTGGWDNTTADGDIPKVSSGWPTAPTLPGFSNSSGSGTSSSQGTSFTGIEDANALSAIKTLIEQLSGGGTADYQAQRAIRNQQINDARIQAQDYTKSAAISDAAALMAQNLRQSLEKNMPTINKAIQSAGASGDAVAALLSQKLATESAQAAGALGATQATQYGQIQAAFQSILENLTKVDTSNVTQLLQALDLFKISKSQQTSQSQQSHSQSSVTSSGGGSILGNRGGYSGGGSSSPVPSYTGNTAVSPDGYMIISDPVTGQVTNYGDPQVGGGITITPSVDYGNWNPSDYGFDDPYDDPYADYYNNGGYGYL